VDACPSFRTDSKVTEQLDWIFMGRRRFLQRTSYFIFIMAATITIASSFDIPIWLNYCR
jgi:hypothetical protein